MKPNRLEVRRPIFWLVAGLAALAVPLAAGAAQSGPRPNIVVVLVDDLRWDEMGCAGHPFASTPNVDRLAREGVLFANSFVTTPLCSPSRASFLTGQYAHTHGITDNTDRGPASHGLKTFPQALQKAGYETAFLGKWHMGNDPTPRPGFDDWAAIPGQGESIDPDIYQRGQLKKIPGYVTDVLTERAVEFIRRPRTKPWLLYLAHKAIHPNIQQRADGSLSDSRAENFIPAPRHQGLYTGATIARRPSAGVAPRDKPALARSLEGVPPLGPDTGSGDAAILGRLRMLAAVDEGLGTILETLKSLGQLDRTLVVFTSDNGYFNGEHGLSVERRLAYEESIRVPLVVRYPPLAAAGRVVESMVLNVDLAPTLLELAGASADWPLEGRSLVPLLAGQSVPWRDEFLIEYFSDRVFARVQNMGYQALRTTRYKYIRYSELPGMDELYDLQADAYEMQNLAGNPAQRALLADMQARLRRLAK